MNEPKVTYNFTPEPTNNVIHPIFSPNICDTQNNEVKQRKLKFSVYVSDFLVIEIIIFKCSSYGVIFLELEIDNIVFICVFLGTDS